MNLQIGNEVRLKEPESELYEGTARVMRIRGGGEILIAFQNSVRLWTYEDKLILMWRWKG